MTAIQPIQVQWMDLSVAACSQQQWKFAINTLNSRQKLKTQSEDAMDFVRSPVSAKYNVTIVMTQTSVDKNEGEERKKANPTMSKISQDSRQPIHSVRGVT